MKIFARFAILAIAILLLPQFVPGIAVSGIRAAVLAALAFGIVNLLVKPVVKLVTLPINLFTLGLFGLLVNAALFWAISVYVPGFAVTSFQGAFVGALALSAIGWLAHFI